MDAAGGDLADLAGAGCDARLGEHAGLDQVAGAAQRVGPGPPVGPILGDQRAGLGLAEILDELDPGQRLLGARDQRDRRRRGAEHELAERAQPVGLERRVGEQHVDLGRHHERAGAAGAFDLGDEPGGVPVFHQHAGAARRDRRREPDEAAGGMIERRRHHVDVVRAEPEIMDRDPGPVRPRFVGQKRALGQPGGAAGERDRGGIGRIERQPGIALRHAGDDLIERHGVGNRPVADDDDVFEARRPVADGLDVGVERRLDDGMARLDQGQRVGDLVIEIARRQMRRDPAGASDAEIGDGVFRAVAAQHPDAVAGLQPAPDQGVREAARRAIERAVIEAACARDDGGLVGILRRRAGEDLSGQHGLSWSRRILAQGEATREGGGETAHERFVGSGSGREVVSQRIEHRRAHAGTAHRHCDGARGELRLAEHAAHAEPLHARAERREMTCAGRVLGCPVKRADHGQAIARDEVGVGVMRDHERRAANRAERDLERPVERTQPGGRGRRVRSVAPAIAGVDRAQHRRHVIDDAHGVARIEPDMRIGASR